MKMDLKIWIRLSANGLYLVDKEVREGNMLSKPEYKTYTFNNISELSKWILNGGN
jgi:hypothetical protein